MPWIGYRIVAALVFGVCFAVDKGISAVFASNPLRRSGKSVRLHKKYGLISIALMVLGAVVMVNCGSFGEDCRLMLAAGALCLVLGIGVGIYYISYGFFYDDEEFIFASFPKKQRRYRFNQITAQQLYTARGTVTVELHMTDGTTVTLQPGLVGHYDFLEAAFRGWCRQKSVHPETCDFYDPDNTCYFPPVRKEDD